MRRLWPAAVLAVLLLGAFLLRRSEPSRSATTSRPVSTSGTPEATSPEAVDRSTPPVPAPTPEAERRQTEDACLTNLRWLLNHQNADGSWGEGPTTIDGVLISKPGLTGLVLAAMMGAGYTHLSKDEFDGLSMGDAVRNGLRWLMEDQREDGMFRSSRGGLDHAVAALALSEAYGMTGSGLFKNQAQASIHALATLQLQDGSWGDGPTTAWAADALKSAEISDLEYSGYDGLRRYYDRRAAPDARELIARIQIDRNKLDPRMGEAAIAVWAARPFDTGSPHDLYLNSRALFQYDGPDGELWKSWSEPFRAWARKGGASRGVGPSETVVLRSLEALTLEVFYRYTSVFVTK